MSAGVDWFPLDTNLLTDDEKVFDLMDGATDAVAFADFGRLVALWCRVYRSGPALQVDRRMARRVARDLGLSVDGFHEFVGRCADAGLIDRTFWENDRVITSRGIQTRWAKAKARAKKSGLPPEFRRWSLIDGDARDSADPSELSPTVAEASPVASAPSEHSPSASDPSENFPSTCDPSENVPSTSEPSENSPLDKIRGDKTRGEEKREEPVGTVSGEGGVFDNPPKKSKEVVEKPEETGGSEYRPACLARPGGPEDVYLDGEDAPHRTRYGALEARYRQHTHRKDFGQLMAKVADMCPASCRASPDDVCECYTLLSRAVDASDPRRGSPWPLVRHILSTDRGERDG